MAQNKQPTEHNKQNTIKHSCVQYDLAYGIFPYKKYQQ